MSRTRSLSSWPKIAGPDIRHLDNTGARDRNYADRARPDLEEDARRNAPHPNDQRLCRAVEPERRRHGAVRPDAGRRIRLRRERLLARRPAPAAAGGVLQAAP